MDTDDGVIAETFEVLPITDVGPLIADGGHGPFSEAELAYARDKSDPERRLAARLAAKRAAVRLLGPGVTEADIEVTRVPGRPPGLRLSARAQAALAKAGAGAALVSLTHGREHAAAAVLLVRAPRVKLFRASLRVLALLLVLGIAAGVYIAYAPYGDTAAHPFNQDRNAVWLEHRWLEKPHSVEEMEQMFRFLDHHGIVYAYPHLIPFDSAGRLPLHNREQMRAFLASARRVAPNMKVLPWVGGLRVGYKRSRSGTIDLGDLGQRQRIVAECRGLMDEGFDGIHVNVEPIANGDDDYLTLLRALRAAVGTGILSLSATRPGPVAPAFAPNFFWTADYYTRIADSADQVVLMTYDTAIPTPDLYRRYVAYAAATVTANLARSHRTRVLVGIPTYDETGLMHRKGVETPENALLGVVSGLRGRAGGTFEGVALYAEWTTDPEDWAVYERVWRGHTVP